MNRVIGFLVGALTGAVVGAAVALLIAPSSGLQTRQQISSSFAEFRNDVRKAAEEKRTELQKQLEALKGPRNAVKIS